MKRVAISVEGRTEEGFINDLVVPHLARYDVFMEAKPVVTKTVIDGPNHVGGSVSVDRAVNEIRKLLPSFDHVTTLYDFYGFRRRQDGETVEALEMRIASAVESWAFTPYIQQYEFEALLFCDDGVIQKLFQSDEGGAEFDAIVRRYANPELINDGRETAPSKRLDDIFTRHLKRPYKKVAFGRLIAGEIGLERMCERCPRFSRWLAELRQLND